MKFKNPTGQLTRWLELLSTNRFVIHHRGGTQHKNADALFRRPCSSRIQCERREKEERDEQMKEAGLGQCRLTRAETGAEEAKSYMDRKMECVDGR